MRFVEYLSAQENTKARGRDYVWLAYLKSTERFPGLYKKLAQWFDTIRVEDMVAIHVDQIARFAGREGIRIQVY